MLTKLEIINQMLASTGTAPLTTNDTNHPFYVKAENKLHAVSKAVQGPGWWFNRAIVTLMPDVNGEIILPSNTLNADPTDRYKHLTVRGTKLYDPQTRSYEINASVECVFIDEVPVENLPFSAQDYVRARAVYEFYRDEEGGQPKLNDYRDERNTAWIVFKGEHLKSQDLNWFDSGAYAQQQRGVRTRRLPLSDN